MSHLIRAASAVGFFAPLFLVSIALAQAPPAWQAQGPERINKDLTEGITNNPGVGAVRVVRPSPDDSNLIYLGAVNGGVWKSENGGASWTPLTDTQPSLSIGALEFDPTDATRKTLLAGIGNTSSLFGIGGVQVGLLYTTDAGSTWTNFGSRELAGLNITSVAARGDIFLAGAPTRSSGTVGLYRSANRGVNFTLVSGSGGLPAGAVTSLAADSSSDSRFFAAVQNRGIFRSEDSGRTWTNVTDARMEIGSTTSNLVVSVGGNGQAVYVAVVKPVTFLGRTKPRLTSVWRGSRNEDGTMSWTDLGLPGSTEAGVFFGIHPGGQGVTHMSLFADPTDPNVVYIGGDRQPQLTEGKRPDNTVVVGRPNSIGANDYSGRLFRGRFDAEEGTTWTPLTHNGTAGNTAPHADSRALVVDRDGRLLNGNDGGIYRRSSPRTSQGDWTSLIGTGLQITEIHSLAWDHVGKSIGAGTQDNCAIGQLAPDGKIYESIAIGDGGEVAINDTTVAGFSFGYYSSQNIGSFQRQKVNTENEELGKQFVSLRVGDQSLFQYEQGNEDELPFYPKVVLNRVDQQRIAIGTLRVYLGTDDVTGDLSNRLALTDIVGSAFASNVTAIAFGNSANANLLLVGSGADVFRSTTAAFGSLARLSQYPGGEVTDLVLHASNASTFYVADGESLFSTTDAGATWTRTLRFPRLRSLEFGTKERNVVFAGGTGAVFGALATNLDDWVVVGAGLPNALVQDLDYDETDDQLVVGTLGRGAWGLKTATRLLPAFTAGRSDTGYIHLVRNNAAGEYTLNGGTLQSAGEATTTLNVTLEAQGGVIETPLFSDSTYRGVISGEGALRKTGPGELTLAGTNTYEGGTRIDEGIVVVARDANLGAAAGALTFGGGGLRLAAGIDSSRDISVLLPGGFIDTVGFDATMRGVISGRGEIEKFGSGKLSLTADSSAFTGAVQVKEGTLNLANNASIGGTTVIESGATLSGSGTTGTLVNRGTVSTGNSVGAIVVDGDFLQEDGGRLIVEVASGTSGDRLRVNGDIVLDGTVEPVFPQGFEGNDDEDFVFLSGESITGTFDNAFEEQVSPTLREVLRYLPTGVEFDAVRTYASAELLASLTPNQRAVAAMLDGLANGAEGDLDGVLDAIDDLDTNAEVARAFDEIASREGPSEARQAYAAALLQSHDVAGRLREARGGAGTSFGGLGLSPSLEYPGGLPRHLLLGESAPGLRGFAPDDVPSGEAGPALEGPPGAARPAREWSLFASGSAVLGEEDGSAARRGFDFSTAGVMVGVDRRVTDWLIAGISTGYHHTGADLDGDGGDLDADLVSLGAFATAYTGGFYVDAAYRYGWSAYDTTRHIVFPGVDREAKGDPDGRQYSLYGGVGYDFRPGRWTLGPSVTVQYVDVHVDDYTEEGAGALNLRVDDLDTESLQVTVGGRVACRWEMSNVVLIPSARASYAHEADDDDLAIRAQLAQPGAAPFATQADGIGRDFAVVGAGVTALLGSRVSAAIEYEGQVGQDDFEAHGVFGGIRIGF